LSAAVPPDWPNRAAIRLGVSRAISLAIPKDLAVRVLGGF
jgi:hypothetical protein